MEKQKTNKVKTVVYLIHFILIDIWARNGVLHIFPLVPFAPWIWTDGNLPGDDADLRWGRWICCSKQLKISPKLSVGQGLAEAEQLCMLQQSALDRISSLSETDTMIL